MTKHLIMIGIVVIIILLIGVGGIILIKKSAPCLENPLVYYAQYLKEKDKDLTCECSFIDKTQVGYFTFDSDGIIIKKDPFLGNYIEEFNFSNSIFLNNVKGGTLENESG